MVRWRTDRAGAFSPASRGHVVVGAQVIVAAAVTPGDPSFGQRLGLTAGEDGTPGAALIGACAFPTAAPGRAGARRRTAGCGPGR